MKKRILAAFLAATMVLTLVVGCSSSKESSDDGESGEVKGSGKEIAVMVPSADHGWTGAVLTYAQEEAEKLTDEGNYEVKVYAATDVENQIQQVDDLLSNPDNLAGIVILPYDNGLQSTLEKIATADIPFVQFDRVIESDIIDEKVVANVKGDNEGIGYETAKRFIENGLTKDDYVYEMIGDNSSVPELRSKGFRTYLTEQGWTEDEINKVVVKSAATGWSRDTGKELFESWFSSSQCDTSKKIWIYTHDDEIAMGVLESLNGSALDETKKAEFMNSLQALAASSGLAEMYAVLDGTHKTIATPEIFDIFSVTYDPAMIQEATEVMVDYLDGKTDIEQNYIIPVSVVDSENVGEFTPFGTYEGK
ncbi:substrate-binding domain-containing protein [Blautia obeum]|uniref:substrate-binding domain-containing protein n=1 Tax=Blautia obeum TaxID=40520 RepID=UPI003CFDF9BD